MRARIALVAAAAFLGAAVALLRGLATEPTVDPDPAGPRAPEPPVVERARPAVTRPPPSLQPPAATPATPAHGEGGSMARLRAGERIEDIFASEPRDAHWAERLEARLARQLRSDLETMVPGATIEAVTCHTATCKVEARADEALADATARAMQVVPLSDAAVFEFDVKEGKLGGAMYLVYDEHRDPDQAEAAYTRLRRERLPLLKPGTGRLQGIAKIPRE